jgi:hypothetical protein
MNKFQRSKVVPEQLRYAVVPKPLLKRFILGRSVHCAVCIVLSVVLLLPLSYLPGLILFILPAEVSLISKIRDETELIQWVRCNMVSGDCKWDDVESETEMTRLRSHDRPGTLQGYTR